MVMMMMICVQVNPGRHNKTLITKERTKRIKTSSKNKLLNSQPQTGPVYRRHSVLHQASSLTVNGGVGSVIQHSRHDMPYHQN